ncbi:MAG: hypothetical protein NVSMB39_2800 [Candidatus Saccharimonadales bacterium]
MKGMVSAMTKIDTDTGIESEPAGPVPEYEPAQQPAEAPAEAPEKVPEHAK